MSLKQFCKQFNPKNDVYIEENFFEKIQILSIKKRKYTFASEEMKNTENYKKNRFKNNLALKKYREEKKLEKLNSKN